MEKCLTKNQIGGQIMPLITGSILATLAGVTGSILAARSVGKVIQRVGERIFPYDKTSQYKGNEQISKNNEKLELMRQEFQQKLTEWQIQAGKESAAYSRETQFMLAQYNTYHNLRHTLIQDAIRNFPLNISPLVLLENNGIDVNFLLGNTNQDFDNGVFSRLDNSIKPLSVFITPIYIDSRVSGKELIAAQIFDNMYSSIESLFVNEYSRNSERPIAFYAAAWNKNVKAGLHAAEELYYFLKDLPTIVVEPRLDGKKLKVMISCWSLGYSGRMHFRQEVPIDIDLNSILVSSVYERSKKALETYNSVDSGNKYVQEQIDRCRHNVEMFEKLNLKERLDKRFKELQAKGSSTELDELDNYSKFFYTEGSDVFAVSEIVSSTIGIIVSCMADTHHLLANDIEPRLPYIYKSYFDDNIISKELRKEIFDMYDNTYIKLKNEFPSQETLRLVQKENVRKRLIGGSKDNSSIKEALTQKCIGLGADRNIVSNWSIAELIDFYIDNLDNDTQFRKNIFPFMTEEQKHRYSNKLQSLI